MPLFEIAAALLKRESDTQSTRHDTSADRGQHFENGFGNFEKCYFFFISRGKRNGRLAEHPTYLYPRMRTLFLARLEIELLVETGISEYRCWRSVVAI